MPSPRKGESLEQFRARSREYMEARAIARGRRPVRRIAREDVPPVVRRRRSAYPPEEAYERRAAFMEQVGMWPERSFRPPLSQPTGGERVQAAKPHGWHSGQVADRAAPQTDGEARRKRQARGHRSRRQSLAGALRGVAGYPRSLVNRKLTLSSRRGAKGAKTTLRIGNVPERFR